ncbi:hypothetical protein EW026_g6512 [Hermanssonia centrifuga]|uniref:ATP-dependent DNA helicase n=1 Tax=Hermanssonia centrifuga TaxID=98765 RepID=A0A4S4KCI3_9APHY|nr:hypothetical protein EW026_g6512 [Hermanssonia centrifuga]
MDIEVLATDTLPELNTSFMSTLDAAKLRLLTTTELRGLISGRLVVPRQHRQPKANLIQWIIAQADEELVAVFIEACEAKLAAASEQRRQQKRKRTDTLRTQRQRRRREYIQEEQGYDVSRYLEMPSEDELLTCYREFITATSNEAVKHLVCAVCAREVSKEKDRVVTTPLDEIPHPERLIPITTHEQHDLYSGMLLEPAGVTVIGEQQFAHLCKDCFDNLERAGRDPPLLSLANNLWIGRIPWELQVLTVPEQMLIALLYPRVYVYKLFPKDKSFRPKDETLQRGMRGNVSTYEQDIEGVASMVEGTLMPRPLEILSHVVTITYVGRGQLLKSTLHTTFRVRRAAVRAALLWLKANNSKYYGEIQIDDERLQLLPEDDVPSEIYEIARHTTDIGIVDQESAGYVPEHADSIPDSVSDAEVLRDQPIGEQVGAEDDVDNGLWVTINPGDSDNPLAQALLGQQINLDDFLATMGPDKETRIKNIAADPYGAAKFFHFTINAILETLVQVRVSNYQVKSKPGIFGEVSAYFGTVESQGRGTLHLHMLIWLKNTPTGAELSELFKDEAFRAKMSAYIKANVRAYVPGLESAETVKALPRQPSVAFSRPPNPDSPSYSEDVREYELQLARGLQVHTCKIRRCLQPNKNGKLVCKRKAPWKCAHEDFVTEDGQWGPKRLYAYVNGYNPPILIHAACNNDCKILTNGSDTKNITFYVTSYAAKKQGRNYNLSAVLADGYAYHQKNPRDEYLDRLRENQRLLLFRLVHTINREQELSSAMVISYLMKWGDVYRSHVYSSVYWSSFVTALVKSFPDIQKAPPSHTNAEPEAETCLPEPLPSGPSTSPADFEPAPVLPLACPPEPTPGSPSTSRAAFEPAPGFPLDAANNQALATLPTFSNDEDDGDSDELVTLEINQRRGQLSARSQVMDYICRGAELHEYNVHDFFTDTYESALLAKPDCPSSAQVPVVTGDESGSGSDADQDEGPHRRRAANKQRVVRSAMHRNIVNYVGRYFPSAKDPTTTPFYCASMLVLLKPWRDLTTDLKSARQTWQSAFEEFVAHADVRTTRIIAGIEYHHDCRTAAANDRRDEENLPVDDSEDRGVMPGIDDMELNEGLPTVHTTISEEAIYSVLQSSISPSERNHAQHAIETARGARMFPNENHGWTVTAPTMHNAEGGDITRLAEWKAQMHQDVLKQNTEEDTLTATAALPIQGPTVAPQTAVGITSNPAPVVTASDAHGQMPGDGILTAASVDMLKADQFRAFDIIRWHLNETLAGSSPPPLRMLIYGEGGTGKSKVIQTVTEEFARRGVKYMLVKTAYTGVAASLIDGKTTHTIAGLTVKTGAAMSDATKGKLQAFWKHRTYLIVDEMSMLGKTHLQSMEKNISVGMQGGDGFRPDCSFGGVNVIMCGDLHQFPPVAQGRAEFLFHPIRSYQDSDESKLGRRLYEQFGTVVVLNEQMRVTDPVWRDLLVHLRAGEVQQRHIQVLQDLVLHRPAAAVDFSQDPWKRASLVTPRHAVRKLWNEHAARKWCNESGTQLFVCSAEDKIHKGKNRTQDLSLVERYYVACRLKTNKSNRKVDLPRSVELAKGMKVLVTSNLETDLDLTNGARGEIVDIVLHPDEKRIEEGPIVHLKYLPVYVLVKMARTRASQLAGLPACVIPVEPASSTMRIKLPTRDGKTIQRTVHRRQFPVTSAYAFTDYRAQGQTLPYVVVDIATPPSGALSLFNLYVALSRSAGRDTIRLLRGFDERQFMQSHDPELALEDERLGTLDAVTKQWWIAMGGEDRMAQRGT